MGRDDEIDLLLRRWARAKSGNGPIVLVSGEPGIGKSRITAALLERLHGEPHIRLRYFCSPYRQDSASFPFIDQLGRAAGFARDDTLTAKLEKLESLLARAAPPAEDVALLVDLLSLPALERQPSIGAQAPSDKQQAKVGFPSPISAVRHNCREGQLWGHDELRFVLGPMPARRPVTHMPVAARSRRSQPRAAGRIRSSSSLHPPAR